MLALLSSSALPKVADWAYRKLFDPDGTGEGLGIQYNKTHIIGFSHGSHVAALIGKRTKGQVRHITLLDPSTSKVHLLTWENLLGKGWTAQQSALFVDMYKTSRDYRTGNHVKKRFKNRFFS